MCGFLVQVRGAFGYSAIGRDLRALGDRLAQQPAADAAD